MKNYENEVYDSFHKCEKYYLTPKKALVEKYKEHISNYKKEIEKFYRQIKSMEKNMTELIDHMNNIKEKME